MADPVIRLDRSKKSSTVHGDRTPDDPHYKVHFFQGKLPFDAGGVLVPDDGKTAIYSGMGPDGKPTLYAPLYNDEMRALVKAKFARLVSGKPPPPEEVSEHDDEDDKRAAAEEVNLSAWLRGEQNWEPHIIFAACAERYGRRHQKLRSVVEDLVLDEKLVPEGEVAPHLMRLIDTPASASI